MLPVEIRARRAISAIVDARNPRLANASSAADNPVAHFVLELLGHRRNATWVLQAAILTTFTYAYFAAGDEPGRG